MWFDSDKAYSEDNHDGFPELITRARLMGWMCLLTFVGFVAVLVLR